MCIRDRVTHVCVSVRLSAAACQHYSTDPDVTWQNGTGCPLVVHYWADLQSVLRFRCYDNIAPRVLAIGAHYSIAANTQCLRLLAVCLVLPEWITPQSSNQDSVCHIILVINTGFPPSSKKFQDFLGPQKILTGRCHSTAKFRCTDK